MPQFDFFYSTPPLFPIEDAEAHNSLNFNTYVHSDCDDVPRQPKPLPLLSDVLRSFGRHLSSTFKGRTVKETLMVLRKKWKKLPPVTVSSSPLAEPVVVLSPNAFICDELYDDYCDAEELGQVHEDSWNSPGTSHLFETSSTAMVGYAILMMMFGVSPLMTMKVAMSIMEL